ncbi:MAG: hypothetical protein HRT77_01580 [Halioglobus sp.]|nr:hypothetical protein [Halioglobus sp.]
MSMLLSMVWLGVVVIYLLSRSLLAAIVFNNMMALIGFVLNDLSLPVGSLAGAALFALALALLYRIARRLVLPS